MPVLAFLPEFVVKDKVKRSSEPKVTEEDVKNIRALHKSGMSYRQLGHKYEISTKCADAFAWGIAIRRSSNGFTWKTKDIRT